MWGQNIGPAELFWGGTDPDPWAANGSSLGLSLGGVTLGFERMTAESKADITGDIPRSLVVTGEKVTVTTAITEATLAQLAVLLGESVSTKELTIASQIGTDLLSTAGRFKCLCIKPIVGGAVSTDDDTFIFVPVATIVPKFEVAFELANQKAYKVEIIGSPVKAEHIASGAHLYVATAVWAVGDLLRFGKNP